MILHHHTKFGYKTLNGSGDIVRQTLDDISNLRCDLDLEHNNQFFPQDIPAYDDVPLNTFGC